MWWWLVLIVPAVVATAVVARIYAYIRGEGTTSIDATTSYSAPSSEETPPHTSPK